MGDLPDIFTFADCPILGDLGPDAEVEHLDPCPRCGRDDERAVFLHFRLDAWQGEPVFHYSHYYAVSNEVRTAVAGAALRGPSFRAMKVTKGPLFAEFSTGRDVHLPEFVELAINSRLNPAARSPSGWWERRGACEACGRAFWDHTPRVDAGLLAALQGRVGPPREVAIAAWDGADIFHHEDGGPPLVTERFASLLSRFAGTTVQFHPARWV